MTTLGDAFRVAMQMRNDLGSEALHVAQERAESSMSKKDYERFAHWNRVVAMIRYIDDNPMRN
jgi:hypothetical protein